MTSQSAYAKALTVYLLVPEIQHPLDAVATEPLPDLESFTVNGIEWTLCIRNSQGKRPEWTEFFREVVGVTRFGLNSSVSALLIIPNGDRFWALTFGRGRFLLREGVVEERFGLRTALNAIEPDKVRAIDKETFDSFASQARQQATDDTDFENFGVNVDRDLLYAVAGVPRETQLGRRLAGKDALCASVKVPMTGVSDYLSLLLSVYKSEAYKKDFGWVDNIYEVRDKTQRRDLDAQLVERLRSGPLTNTWLALPEIMDWQKIKGFSYVSPRSSFSVNDIHLKTFLDCFGSNRSSIDILSLKRSRVICLDDDNEKIDRWSAYRCLYAEISTDKDVFLLTNGHWYKLNREIVEDIKLWYDNLDIDSGLLPEMHVGEGEDVYNKRVGKQSPYRLFHGSLVYMPANRGTIEFCDIAALRENIYDLIHVKRFGASSKLSHLFYQGTNSARLLRTSPEFRKALCESIKEDSVLAKRFSVEPVRHEYRVVFAIASSSISRLELPLFSKLSLRQAIRELDGLGFKTSLAQIALPLEERFVKKERRVRKTF